MKLLSGNSCFLSRRRRRRRQNELRRVRSLALLFLLSRTTCSHPCKRRSERARWWLARRLTDRPTDQLVRVRPPAGWIEDGGKASVTVLTLVYYEKMMVKQLDGSYNVRMGKKVPAQDQTA